jgi:hypothetical protein
MPEEQKKPSQASSSAFAFPTSFLPSGLFGQP